MLSRGCQSKGWQAPLTAQPSKKLRSKPCTPTSSGLGRVAAGSRAMSTPSWVTLNSVLNLFTASSKRLVMLEICCPAEVSSFKLEIVPAAEEAGPSGIARAKPSGS